MREKISEIRRRLRYAGPWDLRHRSEQLVRIGSETVKTPDLGGRATTAEMAKAVKSALVAAVWASAVIAYRAAQRTASAL